MPLRLHADTDHERYTVYSGAVSIGRITRHTSGGERNGQYYWVINRVLLDTGQSMGWGETSEAAMDGLAQSWRAWLKKAGLQEREASG